LWRDLSRIDEQVGLYQRDGVRCGQYSFSSLVFTSFSGSTAWRCERKADGAVMVWVGFGIFFGIVRVTQSDLDLSHRLGEFPLGDYRPEIRDR